MKKIRFATKILKKVLFIRTFSTKFAVKAPYLRLNYEGLLIMPFPILKVDIGKITDSVAKKNAVI